MNVHLAVTPVGLFACVLAVANCLSPTDSKADEPDKAAPAAADSMIGKEPGQVRDDNWLKMKLVWCPPGFVTMEQVEQSKRVDEIETPAARVDESDDDRVVDKPVPRPRTTRINPVNPVKVFITDGYWLGKYEVTQSEWKQLMETEPWKGQKFTKDGDDFPATFISWKDAMEFCQKLTEREHKEGHMPGNWEYTLPTEAQWERGCRARAESRFSFGNAESDLRDYVWYRENTVKAGEEYAHRVGQKQPNPWGLFDVHGNVWEWCRDVYAEKLPGGRDPEVSQGGSNRVIRGGGWGDAAGSCRSAVRRKDRLSDRNQILGFRVACSLSGNK